MIPYHNLNFLIATCFGFGKLGKIFKCPGTIGSIIAFPIAYYLFSLVITICQLLGFTNLISFPLFVIPCIILVILLFFIGAFGAGRYAKMLVKEDPGEIIIDEVVGQMLCAILSLPFAVGFLMAKVPMDLLLIGSILINLLLFRLFDIFKPWPINWFDKNIKGGFGIMLDDIIAAIFAAVVYNVLLIMLVNHLNAM